MDLKEGEIIKILEKEKIKEIYDKKVRDKKLIFTGYYNYGIMKRNIEHSETLKILPQVEKIFAIEVEKIKGKVGYEFFYKLSSNQSFSISTFPSKKKVIVNHAILYNRSLQKRFPSVKLK